MIDRDSTDRDKLIAQLVRQESTKFVAYRDPRGFLTIGTGRCIDASVAGSGITQDEAALLLENDIDRAVHGLLARWPWIADLDPVRQAVLVNMSFNLGLSGLDGFHQTLQAIEQRRYSAAADAMLNSKWASQVGVRAVELAAQMKTGAWQA